MNRIPDPMLPAWPRRVAVARALPDSWVLAVGALVVAHLVLDVTWPLWVGLAVVLYTLVTGGIRERWDPACETADHWHGQDEPPADLSEECAYCRDIPFRELWRGGRR